MMPKPELVTIRFLVGPYLIDAYAYKIGLTFTPCGFNVTVNKSDYEERMMKLKG